MATHEHTLNVALGEILGELRPHSWRVVSEEQGQLSGGGRPDILIEEASQWPVVIEAERTSHDSAELDAGGRLGRVVNETGKPIESAIALVYPKAVLDLSEQSLRDALRQTDDIEYALYTRTTGDDAERLPESGWLKGSAKDLAMLVHRASMPAPRIERLGEVLEYGIETAAGRFTRRHGSHESGELGPDIAELLGQADDQGGQTRRMAMTVLINALIFHEALAEAGFRIERMGPVPASSGDPLGSPSPPPSGDPLGAEHPTGRRVNPLSHFRDSEYSYQRDALTDEWNHILEVNYWPIFATAREILRKLPSPTVGEVLQPLWNAANQLVQGGVTKSHDLTGVIFQRLIADRKFLATFYTRPAAAALLAGLAIPADRAPGGAEWGDEETIAALQVGDFACGTGTLLSAAYQRISLLHELNGGDPRKLHAPMMKHGLVGLDVLNIAVHLTAATLAGAHPDVPFDGECLLTMPYGGESASIGSLELLAEHVSPNMIDDAAAVTAGGRRPEDVRDLMTQVGHGQFDLVIMNPPFTRATSHEGGNIGQGSPAFAAFETTREEQQAILKHLNKMAGSNRLGNMRAGLGTHFVDLGLRKLRSGGTLALVLPTSSLSGSLWQDIRDALKSNCAEITVVTILASGSFDRSFSADTGIAECLVLAVGRGGATDRGRFVLLSGQPTATSLVDHLSKSIRDRFNSFDSSLSQNDEIIFGLLHGGSGTAERLISSPLPSDGPWPIAGVDDFELILTATNLSQGLLLKVGSPYGELVELRIEAICTLAKVGFSDMEIAGDKPDGDPQGPFELIRPLTSSYPTYPILWNHNAKLERKLTVAFDSEGRVKQIPRLQTEIDRDAATVWATASRAHYNRDLQFNAQSTVVAMTNDKCIGGRAWPSVILHNPNHEFAFSLWCNSTLGVLLHWWVSNKTQAGRGTTTVTGIPNIPTLDTRALTDEQHAEAKRQFELLSEERLLPFDQIDEDPARARLDRAILVDVLGLPESLVARDGPIDLIRRKLAREPQIHGGKKSRVVFTDEGEKSVKRDDRG